MIEGGTKELPLIVSEDFLSKIRRTEDNIQSGVRHNDLPNFAIRYSVPTAPLKQNNNDLQLRKTTRGEYIVEDPAAANAPTLGMEQDEGSQANNSGPMMASFRGPGNVAYDAECVLIYNSEAEKYELHLLEMNIQVSPVLKGRPRAANSSGSGAAGASSSGQSQANENSLRDRKLHDIRPNSKGLQKTPQGAVAKTPPISPTKRSASPTKGLSASQTTTESVNSAKPSNGNTKSAAFLPKRSTKAKLPTRRKLAPAKPKLGPLPSEAATPETPSRAGFIDSASNSTSVSKNASASPSSTSALSSAATSPKKASASPQPVKSPSPMPPVDAGFDESFDDLADELAGDLMEDEEQQQSPDSHFVGTAGGSAEDEDVSSEEE